MVLSHSTLCLRARDYLKWLSQYPRGDHSLLYFAYMCVRDLFIGGVIYLAIKIIRWWYFTCKKHENIICVGILYVNMFHYFKIPSFTCNFFTKLTYNEYIGPYFSSHVVLRFSHSDLPRPIPMVRPLDESEGSSPLQGHNSWLTCEVPLIEVLPPRITRQQIK
jgi:hypothetical protein